MSSSPRDLLFRVSAVGAVIAAMFHAAAMLSPAIARLEYSPTYPAARHVVFIIIDLALGWLLLRRPRWLVWAFAVLTLQQLNGHGRGAWTLWTEHRRIDWISVVVSVFALAVLALLIIDRRRPRAVTIPARHPSGS
jgi:hypothetical protein